MNAWWFYCLPAVGRINNRWYSEDGEGEFRGCGGVGSFCSGARERRGEGVPWFARLNHAEYYTSIYVRPGPEPLSTRGLPSHCPASALDDTASEALSFVV